MAADLEWLQTAHREPSDRAALQQVRASVMRQLESEQGRWKGPWGRWLPIAWAWQLVAASAALLILIGGVAWWAAESEPSRSHVAQVDSNPGKKADPTGEPQRGSTQPLDISANAGKNGATAPSPGVETARKSEGSSPASHRREQVAVLTGNREKTPREGPASPPAASQENLATVPADKPAVPEKRLAADPAAMEVVTVSLEQQPNEPASETVMVKIPTSNPDIVVYWLMDEPNKGD